VGTQHTPTIESAPLNMWTWIKHLGRRTMWLSTTTMHTLVSALLQQAL